MTLNTTVHRSKRQLIAVALEAVEGVAETFTNPDSSEKLIYDLQFDPEIEQFMREAVTLGDLSKPRSVPGIETATISGRFELKSHGDREAVPTVTDDPEWSDIALCCGTQKETLKLLTTTALTGTFIDGETVTGASDGSGVVYKDTISGLSLIVVESVAFSTTSQVITGGSSGATATLTVVGTDYGLLWRPLSDFDKSATIAAYWNSGEAGSPGNYLALKAIGCRGNLAIVANRVGQPVFGEFTFQGKLDSIQDAAWISGVPDFDPQMPPTFDGADFLSYHGYTPMFSTFRMDMGNALEQRLDGNVGGALRSYYIGDRKPVISIDPEVTKSATFDPLAQLRAGTYGEFNWALGGAIRGDRVEFTVPNSVITSIKPADRGLVKVWNTGFDCVKQGVNGTKDRDFLLSTS
jgi:hypothetical protein